jgi:hypothetical protein
MTNIYVSFAPFIVFAVVDRALGVNPALIVASIVSAAIIFVDIIVQNRRPKLLEVGSLAIFGLLASLVMGLGFEPSIIEVRALVDTGLLLLVTGSLVIGRPFTMAYVRAEYSSEVTTRRRFESTCTKLAWCWAGALTVMVGTECAMILFPNIPTILGTVVITGSLLVVIWLTNRYRGASFQ